MSANGLRAVGALFGTELRVSRLSIHLPGVTSIAQAHVEHFPQPRARMPGRDRRDHLDACREVAMHPIGRADEEGAVERISTARGEVEDARVLEESAHDRPDPDRLGEARNSRYQA